MNHHTRHYQWARAVEVLVVVEMVKLLRVLCASGQKNGSLSLRPSIGCAAWIRPAAETAASIVVNYVSWTSALRRGGQERAPK